MKYQYGVNSAKLRLEATLKETRINMISRQSMKEDATSATQWKINENMSEVKKIFLKSTAYCFSRNNKKKKLVKSFHHLLCCAQLLFTAIPFPALDPITAVAISQQR